MSVNVNSLTPLDRKRAKPTSPIEPLNPDQSKTPLLAQHDLRNMLIAAARLRNISEVAPRLGRDLTRSERQLLSLCGVICEIIAGSLGEDGDGEPIGDLRLKAQPYVRATYQPKLSGGNGH